MTSKKQKSGDHKKLKEQKIVIYNNSVISTNSELKKFPLLYIAGAFAAHC